MVEIVRTPDVPVGRPEPAVGIVDRVSYVMGLNWGENFVDGGLKDVDRVDEPSYAQGRTPPSEVVGVGSRWRTVPRASRRGRCPQPRHDRPSAAPFRR